MGMSCFKEKKSHFEYQVKNKVLNQCPSQQIRLSKFTQDDYSYPQYNFKFQKQQQGHCYTLNSQCLYTKMHQQLQLGKSIKQFNNSKKLQLFKMNFKKDLLQNQILLRKCLHSATSFWKRQGVKLITIQLENYMIYKSIEKQSIKNINYQNQTIDQIHLIFNKKQNKTPQKAIVIRMEANSTKMQLLKNKNQLKQHIIQKNQTYKEDISILTPLINILILTKGNHNHNNNQPLQNINLKHFLDLIQKQPIQNIYDDIYLYLYPGLNEVSLQSNQSFIRLETYYEMSCYITTNFHSIWEVNTLQMLKTTSEAYYGYLVIEIIKHVIDYTDNSISTNELIIELLTMSQVMMNKIYMLGRIILMLTGVQNEIDLNRMCTLLLNSVRQHIVVIADGLYYQFGYEINQIQHPYQHDSLHFMMLPNEGVIHYQMKTIIYNQSNLVDYLLHLFNNLRQQTNLSIEILKNYENQMSLSYPKLNQYYKNQTKLWKQNQLIDLNNMQNIYYQDAIYRLHLLGFIFNNQIEHWQQLQYKIHECYLSAQCLLMFLTIGAIYICSNSQQIDTYFMRAIDICHRIYGDPRVCQGTNIVKSIYGKWQLLVLQQYIVFNRNSNNFKQILYLQNILDCLLEDYPEEKSNSQNWITNEWIIKYAPINSFKGLLFLYRQIITNENQISEYSNSNLTENSSTSSKRSKKSMQKIEECESSYNLTKFHGVIKWGDKMDIAPMIHAPFKNLQVLAIASGNCHGALLTENGVYGWKQGSNQKSYYDIQLLKTVQIRRNYDSFKLSCGNQHTAFLLNGLLSMWGQQDGGILGGNGYNFDDVCCGGLHTLAIREGRVLSWGRGEGGQLGQPIQVLHQQKKQQTIQFYIKEPTIIARINNAIKIKCGDAHSIALTADGIVYVFGFSYQGQLGLGLTGDSHIFQVFQPTKLDFFQDIKIIDVFTGPTFSFFKTIRNQIYSCGISDCLQLGIERVTKVFSKKKYIQRLEASNSQKSKIGEIQFSKPKKIDIFGNKEAISIEVKDIICGENHCLAFVQYMEKQSMIMGWGLNKQYQICNEFPENVTPRTIDNFYGIDVKELCCSSNYSMARIGNLWMTEGELKQYVLNIVHKCEEYWRIGVQN